MYQNKTVFILSLLLIINPVSAEISNADWKEYLLLDDNVHYIHIESYSWYYLAYDLNNVANLVKQGYSMDDAMQSSVYEDRIGRLYRNTTVYLTAQSFDIQHGFAINEFSVQLTLDRALPGEQWGPLVSANFTTMNEDTTITAYCQIYCGLGHANEKIKFIIGDGSTEYGKYAFAFFISLNCIIFAIMVLKIKRKIIT